MFPLLSLLPSPSHLALSYPTSCPHHLAPLCCHLSTSPGPTKSAMVHTLSMNARCPLPPAIAIAEISSDAHRRHHLPRLRRVISVVGHALMGVVAQPLVPGVLTPIFPSYATRALVMPVQRMVSTSLWRHSVTMRTSSRLVRASRITSLASWTTPLLRLGSSGATRQTSMPIVFTRRMTPCG